MTIAAINLDGILPLIIGLIWVIAQIAGAAAKKKTTPPGRPRQPWMDNGETEDAPALGGADGFADLIRQLSGAQEVTAPTPPRPKNLPAQPLWEPDETEPQPIAQPVTQTAPALKPELDKVAAVDIRPAMSSFKVAMPAMKLPAMNLSFRTSEKSGSGVPRVGKIINPADKQTLRRAVLGQIILGKPRSMEGWSHGAAK